jgi:hypothetical protein
MAPAHNHHLSIDEALARRLQLEDELRHADSEWRDLELARHYARMDLQEQPPHQAQDEGVPQMPAVRLQRASSFDSRSGSTRHLEQHLENHPLPHQDYQDAYAGGGGGGGGERRGNHHRAQSFDTALGAKFGSTSTSASRLSRRVRGSRR